MRPERIGFFNSCRHWGGGEKWHLETAVHFAQRGHPVLLVTHRRGALHDKAEASPVAHHALAVSNLSFLNPFKILRIARLLRRQEVGVLFLNLPADLKVAAPAARLAGVRKIVYRRGSAIAVRDSGLNRWLLRRCVDLVLANSEATRTALLARNPALIPAERIAVIHNGLDLAAFDAEPGAPSARQAGREIVLGTAGRLVEQKNHRFLIELARRLKDGGLPFRLLIAGSGPLASELSALAAARGVSEEVRFLGFVTDMKPFLSSLDVFLLSSRWEGFAYVLVEAMAARKPVISFLASNEGEIIVDGETGWLVPPGDLDAFAAKVIGFHEQRDRIAAFGEAGRRRVEETFTLERALDRIEKLILA